MQFPRHLHIHLARTAECQVARHADAGRWHIEAHSSAIDLANRISASASVAAPTLALSSASAWDATLLDGFYWFLGYFFMAGVLGLLLAKRMASLRPTASKPLCDALLPEKS